MGSYNTAVLTTAGQALLASAIAGGDSVTFSKFQTSSYQYASTTDLAALTYLNDVEQEVAPSGGGVTGDTTIYSSATVTSENVALEYENYTVGLFASDGENEVLFAVSTAITPDVIPADDGTTPSTYTYTMNIGVSTTENLVIEVSPTVYLTKGSVIDSLTSPTTDQPLSANQGRVLKQMIDDGAKALKVDYVGAETTKAYPENGVIYYSNKFYKVIKEGGLPANYTIVPATDLDDAGLDPETIITINDIPANGIINASDVTFDNTGTGMAATNVQGAVTELNSKITDRRNLAQALYNNQDVFIYGSVANGQLLLEFPHPFGVQPTNVTLVSNPNLVQYGVVDKTTVTPTINGDLLQVALPSKTDCPVGNMVTVVVRYTF